MRKFLIGIGAGISAGYFVVRTIQAAGDARSPQPHLQADPAAYGRLRRRLMIGGIVRSAGTIGWLAFAFVPSIEGTPSPAKRRALIAAGLALDALAGTPVDYVEDFVLERRYGLSDQTAAAWLTERAKSSAVTIAFSLPLIEALCALIGRAPGRWPALATAGAVPLLILANLIVPVFIAPLFNRFEPIEGDLEARLRTLAGRINVGDADILRVDMSKQTRKANAYVTGLFNTKRIVVGDTLIQHFAPDEIEFVVAHELGHYVNRDSWRLVGASTLGAAFIFFGSRTLASGDKPLTSLTGLLRLSFFGTLGSLCVTPFIAAFSRSRERAADEFAIATTNAPASGVAAFQRLRDQNMAEDEQPRWMELLFSTHPSLRSRIERLEAVEDGTV